MKRINRIYYSILTQFYIYLKTGIFNKNIRVIGAKIDLKIDGKAIISQSAPMIFVNSSRYSTLGMSRPCKINVYKNAELIMHGKIGVSNSTIIVTKRVEMGDNVMIGGGVTIMDSDFHSSDYKDWFTPNDRLNMDSKEVVIGDNVFIGMNAIILKGVHIGDGAVIAAGSVVSRDIPANEIWGGNPACYIKQRIKLAE